jgi:hypothetical protein
MIEFTESQSNPFVYEYKTNLASKNTAKQNRKASPLYLPPISHPPLRDLRLNPASLQALCAATDNPGPNFWHLSLEGFDVEVVVAEAGADDVGGHL